MKEQNIIMHYDSTVYHTVSCADCCRLFAGISQFLPFQWRCRRPHRFPVYAENDMVSQSITKET